MIIEARELAEGEVLTCRVCVVGTGAAGLSLANELNRPDLDLIVLEAGGMGFERQTQDLYRGEVLDPTTHSVLHQYRERRLGGTTATWGGRCIPFDEIDFERRSYVPLSGWPFGKSELVDYYRRAHDYCEVGKNAYSVGEALPDAARSMVPGFEGNAVSIDRIERWSPPTHFGRRHLGPIRDSPNARLLLHANCVRICLTPEGDAVDSVLVGVLDGPSFRVRASEYVLATGGLEAARLLLASNDVQPRGIGNDSDRVGRTYMSHISGTVGPIRFKSDGVVYDYEKTVDGIYSRRRFSITEDAQRRHEMLNFGAFLQHPSIVDPVHRNAILSAMYLVKRFWVHKAPPEFSKELTLMRHPRRFVFGHMRNIALGSPALAAFSVQWLRKRILASRRIPSVALRSYSNTYHLHFHAEQCPNLDSRITLGDELDALKVPMPRVDWKITDLDVSSVIQGLRLISDELRQSGSGELELDDREVERVVREDVAVGGHHIGTTRMSMSPSEGVVDEHCRVHGVRNLHISSSSVFPTGSHANPTLTIVAMAIRLADRLKLALSA